MELTFGLGTPHYEDECVVDKEYYRKDKKYEEVAQNLGGAHW